MMSAGKERSVGTGKVDDRTDDSRPDETFADDRLTIHQQTTVDSLKQ